jgi:hypothetical protein
MKTATQKQVALTKYRSLTLAALDYHLEKFTGLIVYDQYDSLKEYYEQQQVQVEKYYKLGRLDRLEQQFARLTVQQKQFPDMHFDNYIETKTGYKLGYFEELKARVKAIVEQGKIAYGQEQIDIMRMLDFKGNNTVLLSLLPYEVRLSMEMTKKHRGFRIEGGPNEAIAPDGKRKIMVIHPEGKHACTHINIFFKEISAPIYGTMGICPEVKASWKDNQTILIETLKSYDSHTKYAQVSNFADVIKIEYLEH